jgi:DNA polymerase III gamma/tau subunit
MRDALSMLEQVANLTNSDIKLNDVNEVFGLIDTQNIINFLKDIIKNDITHALTALNGYVMKGCNLLIFVENLINLLIDKAVALKENKKVDNEIDLSFEQVIKLLTV